MQAPAGAGAGELAADPSGRTPAGHDGESPAVLTSAGQALRRSPDLPRRLLHIHGSIGAPVELRRAVRILRALGDPGADSDPDLRAIHLQRLREGAVDPVLHAEQRVIPRLDQQDGRELVAPDAREAVVVAENLQ